MTTRNVDRTEWSHYLDRISKLSAGRQVRIEVDSKSIGSQVEAEWAALTGLTYDPKDDLVDVANGALDHMIRKPRSIAAREEQGRIESIEIVDSDGAKHIVQFRDPPTLPAS